MFNRKSNPLEYKSDWQSVTLYDRAKSKTIKGSLIMVQRLVERQEFVEQEQVKPKAEVRVDKGVVQDRKLTAQMVREGREAEKNDQESIQPKKAVQLPKIEVKLPKLHFSLPARLGRMMAVLCLILSLTGIIYTAAPVIGAYYLAKTAQPIEPPKGKLPVEVRLAEMTPLPTYQPVDLEDFFLTIPKINLDSKVLANVDINAESEYQAKLLETGVAHAKGSYLPGENGPTVLFAHSTDTLENIVTYNAKFFAAKDLVAGDEIVMQFDHKVYRYQVVGQQVIDPSDIDAIRNSGADLVLLTCYPPGTSWKRLLIFAKQI